MFPRDVFIRERKNILRQTTIRSTHLIRDVIAELATSRRDVEREHATLVGIPRVQHVVAHFKDIARLFSTTRQARSDVLEQSFLVQPQQVRARWHFIELRNTRCKVMTRDPVQQQTPSAAQQLSLLRPTWRPLGSSRNDRWQPCSRHFVASCVRVCDFARD